MCGLHSGLQSLGLRVSKPCRNWTSKSAVRLEFDNDVRELADPSQLGTSEPVKCF